MIYSVSGFCKVGLKVYSIMRFHTEQKILVFTNITNQMYIQIKNLTKTFKNNYAVNKISFDIEKRNN